MSACFGKRAVRRTGQHGVRCRQRRNTGPWSSAERRVALRRTVPGAHARASVRRRMTGDEQTDVRIVDLPDDLLGRACFEHREWGRCWCVAAVRMARVGSRRAPAFSFARPNQSDAIPAFARDGAAPSRREAIFSVKKFCALPPRDCVSSRSMGRRFCMPPTHDCVMSYTSRCRRKAMRCSHFLLAIFSALRCNGEQQTSASRAPKRCLRMPLAMRGVVASIPFVKRSRCFFHCSVVIGMECISIRECTVATSPFQ